MTLPRFALALALAGALAAPAMAASAPAPAWAVNKAASSLGFRVAYQGAPLNGTFRNWDAQIAFDPKNLAASRVSVTVDLPSVTANDPDAQEALPSADWFDARRTPRATFVSNSFRDLGGGKYQAVGTLTLRGVSRPLVLPFTLAINGAQARMTGQASLNRGEFGVGQGQFKGGDTVALNVAVNVAVTARRR
jgi:polyisoprenoid-binding protein YceI